MLYIKFGSVVGERYNHTVFVSNRHPRIRDHDFDPVPLWTRYRSATMTFENLFSDYRPGCTAAEYYNNNNKTETKIQVRTENRSAANC